MVVHMSLIDRIELRDRVKGIANEADLILTSLDEDKDLFNSVLPVLRAHRVAVKLYFEQHPPADGSRDWDPGGVIGTGRKLDEALEGFVDLP